jgi:hypothetical protein
MAVEVDWEKLRAKPVDLTQRSRRRSATFLPRYDCDGRRRKRPPPKKSRILWCNRSAVFENDGFVDEDELDFRADVYDGHILDSRLGRRLRLLTEDEQADRENTDQ